VGRVGQDQDLKKMV